MGQPSPIPTTTRLAGWYKAVGAGRRVTWPTRRLQRRYDADPLRQFSLLESARAQGQHLTRIIGQGEERKGEEVGDLSGAGCERSECETYRQRY
jgi:hypothetical protein